MNSHSKEYRPLAQDVDLETDEPIRKSSNTLFSRFSTLSILTTLTFVILSFTYLIFLHKYFALQARYLQLEDEHSTLIQDYNVVKSHMHIQKSPYASLEPEIPSTYYEATAFNDPENEDLSNELWDSIDFNSGVVALSDEYAESKGLPIAQRFPWDEKKGIYLLNAHHHLHCLKSIHRSIFEYRMSLPQSKAPWHLNHCLDALRREVICNADDTPRVTRMNDSPNSGVAQVRQCKSWEKLEAWALENTACFRYNTTSSHFLENFMACPEDSPYLARIKMMSLENDDSS